jgi:Raf kinase inhibitor-like YbhB/YbcL family protein
MHRLGFTLLISTLAAAAVAAAPIHVTSPAFGPGDHIPARYGRATGNVSPPLAWTPAPGARAYALIVDDPDAAHPQPFVHWLVWNIPAGVTRIGEGQAPAAASEGRNGFGDLGYGGPQPPSGTHHYRFQVFALDAPLRLPAGAERDAAAAAMHGHVIASGEIVGLFSAPR